MAVDAEVVAVLLAGRAVLDVTKVVVEAVAPSQTGQLTGVGAWSTKNKRKVHIRSDKNNSNV